MQKATNLLIVGGTGFIGSALTIECSKFQGLNIIVLHLGELKNEEKVKNVHYKKIDLSKKSDEAKELIKNADVAVLMTQPNESLIQNFLEYANDSNLKKIIFTSTLLLYKDSEHPQDEKSPVEPISPYEHGKLFEERLLKKFANRKTKVCVTRLANVYGDKKNTGIVNIIIEKLLGDRAFEVNGDGEHKRDYIFIEDVVSALAKIILIQQKEDFSIYNICTGKSYSNNDLIEILERISGKKLKKKRIKAKVEKRSILGDNKKIKNTIDLELKFDLEKGLRKAYNNYLA